VDDEKDDKYLPDVAGREAQLKRGREVVAYYNCNGCHTFDGRDGERQGLGTGFIVDPKGLVATNLHVIGEARPIQVQLADGRKTFLDFREKAPLAALAVQPWFERVVIEADPYRFPEQHVRLLRDFGSEANLANVTPGQILRLEGFRRGIGRAVNYSLLSGNASHPAGSAM